MNESAYSCYGVIIRLIDRSDSEICSRIKDLLPPEFAADSSARPATVTLTVAEEPDCGPDAERYRIAVGNGETITDIDADELLLRLRHVIDKLVSQEATDVLFVHAGVVLWRGLAILIPGRSFTGKTTLVAELVKLGAVYYSDEFAVLDDSGRVHPYRRPLILRGEREPLAGLRLLREDHAYEPAPIGVIVAAPYLAGANWHPSLIHGVQAVLPLIDSTVLARQESTRILQISARIAPTVLTLSGPRSDASLVAGHLLDLIDDALLSQALAPANGAGDSLSVDLKRVAERRFKGDASRPAPIFRDLMATRYVRMDDFLSPTEHQRLFEQVLALEEQFSESGVVGHQGGGGTVDYQSRRSRTISGDALDEIWKQFEIRLRAMLPAIRQQLGLPWFPIEHIERQITAHGDGDFFVPHTDTGSPCTSNRRITCVYYFHAKPQRYTGGDLKIYDMWVTPGSTSSAWTHTTITPVDNSIIFFPSDAFHEVCPVHREGESFADNRFAMTIWIRAGENHVLDRNLIEATQA